MNAQDALVYGKFFLLRALDLLRQEVTAGFYSEMLLTRLFLQFDSSKNVWSVHLLNENHCSKAVWFGDLR